MLIVIKILDMGCLIMTKESFKRILDIQNNKRLTEFVLEYFKNKYATIKSIKFINRPNENMYMFEINDKMYIFNFVRKEYMIKE